ncbi:MAG: DUF2149 domain-containing protein [Chthoniobacteraceae bacterium]|nr:DUF2149 domain-containing protein [Chthoniobacteraceae bacterium]
MRHKKRKWDESAEDDPAAGLLNLFDVWIAFAVALLLASISYQQLTKEGSPGMAVIQKDRQKMEHYRVSDETKGGDGQRLGVAYRLKNGEVIYVPENKP